MSVPAGTTSQASPAADTAAAGPEREDIGAGHLMGNLTVDPELRYTPSGRAVVSLRVAFTQRLRNDRTGKWFDTDPEYYDIQVWGEQGERAAEYLRRGDRIVAAGNWVRERYTSRDGEPKTALRLVARDVGPSMLFRTVRIDRDDRRRRGAAPAVPTSVPRPEGQRPTPPPPPDDPWAEQAGPVVDDGDLGGGQ